MNWYHALNKPLLNPPDWIFAPAWTLLYSMMAVSLALLLVTPGKKSKLKPVILFTMQLILNLLWTPAFFYLRNVKLSFVILCLLWAVVIFTIRSFFRYSKPAAIILVPYFLWLTFALYLNFEIVRLN